MADTKTKFIGGEDSPIPVLDYFLCDANTIIEGGRLLWTRRDTGNAQTSTYALANPGNVICWGVCIEQLNNATPTAGLNVNGAGNSGLAGPPGRYQRGIALLQGDGSFTPAASLGLPVYLVSDTTGTNNGLVTVSTNSLAGVRPLVGFITTNPRSATSNPDPSKIPVAVGLTSYPAGIPATLQSDYVDDTTIHTGAFTVNPGVMHSFNFQSTANINFPAVSAAIDGYRVALLNQGTGATASTLVAAGVYNVGIAGAGTTGATAAGPASLKAQSYVANLTLGAWVPSI